MQKPTITCIDEISGRVLISAPDTLDGTAIGLFLDKQLAAWGTAKVAKGHALVMGRGPLPSSYSLRVVQYAFKPKPAPVVVPDEIK